MVSLSQDKIRQTQLDKHQLFEVVDKQMNSKMKNYMVEVLKKTDDETIPEAKSELEAASFEILDKFNR